MRRAVSRHKLCVISADYRFAPQARLPEIFSDVKDCITFIRSSLAAQFPADAVDVSRLAVSGSSAGGYLALLAGLYTEPKPTCLVPIYPITDPLGTFFTTSQPPPSFRPYLASRDELAECLDPNGRVVANCGPLGEDVRMGMYVRMMADANLASLHGIDDEKAAAPWRVCRQVETLGLPMMYVIHGDGDESVGVEQADELVDAATGSRGKETVVYERVPGANHFLVRTSSRTTAARLRHALRWSLAGFVCGRIICSSISRGAVYMTCTCTHYTPAQMHLSVRSNILPGRWRGVRKRADVCVAYTAAGRCDEGMMAPRSSLAVRQIAHEEHADSIRGVYRRFLKCTYLCCITQSQGPNAESQQELSNSYETSFQS